MINAAIVYSLVLVAAFGLAYWAFRARGDRSALVGLYLLFGLPGALLTVAGVVYLLGGSDLGRVMLPVGLGMALPLVRPVRVAIGRVTPIDPTSPVDMTGLCLLLPAVAALLVAGVVDPAVPDAGEVPAVRSIDLLLQVVLEVGLAYAAVGWPVARGLGAATARLGIRLPSWRTLGAGVGFVVLAFAANLVLAVVTTAFDPDAFDDVNAVTEELTAGVQNPVGAALLGVSAGAGEEAIFRGAMQPRFGIPLTSVAFALVHAPQYGFSPVIVGLLVVSVLLGIERNRFGTTAAMLTHALYNFTAVMAAAAQ